MKILVALLLLLQAPDEFTAGVKKIAAPGAPGPVCVFGDRAFAVIAAPRAPAVAAAEWGKGRAVAFGHNGYFTAPVLAVADTGAFLTNCVRWAAGKAGAKPRVACGWSELGTLLEKQGMEVSAVKRETWKDALAKTDVAVLPPDWMAAAEDVAKVAAYIQAGGGFLTGAPGWGWQQVNPGKSLVDDFPGNRLLAPAGIVWADGTLDGGTFSADRPSDLLHAGKALALLQSGAAKPGDLAQASDTLTRAARALPSTDMLLLPKLRALRRGPAVFPLKAEAALDRVLLALEVDETRRLPASKVKAHPSAKAFPGEVPADAARVTRKVTVDARIPGWHSTGLYAAPGEVVTVTGPRGVQVRIGAHRDSLWALPVWQRVPEITQQWPIGAAPLEIASAFGGALYVDVPAKSELGAVEVEFRRAVEAPLYVLGATTPEQWKAARLHPAPWAELATRKVILSVPSKVVRELDAPDELLKFWDRMMDACADLAAIPRERPRPERYVPDLQISAGYMHSGYPIMTHLDVEKKMVDVKKLMADGWGFWHEMGHNHQVSDWTFEGTGEVTNNLFSVYVCETLCAQPEGHSEVKAERRRKAREKHVASGAPFEAWKADPFLALDMYLLMKEAFGWETYTKVFAEYRKLGAAERPKGDAEKRDQWLVRFSRTAGRNLGPYFQAWGVPTSEAARKSVEDLPAWMPEGFPKGK